MADKPNIPVKNTGDQFTAEEVNEIVDFFETKPDGPEDFDDGSIEEGKLSSLVQEKLRNAGSLTEGTLDPDRIGNESIEEGKLSDDLQTKVNERTTDASDLTSGTLPADRIGDSSIVEGKLSDDLQDKINGIVPRNLLDINRQEIEPSWRSSGVDSKPNINVFYTHSNPGYNASNINEVVEHIDASESSFDYEGNTMKIKCPNNANLFLYINTKQNELNASIDSDYLWFNFEIYSDSTLTINIRATTNAGISIGTYLGNVTVDETVQNISKDNHYQ